MIFKRAVVQYLNRPLRDLSKRKSWSAEKVAKKLAGLNPRPEFVTEPYLHQKAGFLLAVANPGVMLFYDMGLGKSKLVLDAVRYLRCAGKLDRVLILIPNVVNFESWREQIAAHAPDLAADYVCGTAKKRGEAWRGRSPLCFCTYAGLQALLCSYVESRGKSENGKRKRKRKLDPGLLREACRIFDGVVFDECQALMHHQSLNYQIARRFGGSLSWRIGLTGTPMGRDPYVLWAQFHCVDRGEALGPTLGLFRQTFFISKPGYFGGVDYLFKRRMAPQLRRMMNHSSIRYSSEECVDLPEKVMVERPFAMTEEAWRYYSAVLDQARESGRKMLDLTGVFVRLRQVASGFISLDGEPSGLEQNPKLDLLLELLGELDPSEKVVLFNEFIYSGNLIEETLRAEGIGTARLYSGTPNKPRELRRFIDDEDCRVFIVNSQSGAQGLNLQRASYVIFYESPVSPIVRQQAEKRCHRPGQLQRVFIYDLVGRHTVEQRILRFLAEGKDLLAALVEGDMSVLLER